MKWSSIPACSSVWWILKNSEKKTNEVKQNTLDFYFKLFNHLNDMTFYKPCNMATWKLFPYDFLSISFLLSISFTLPCPHLIYFKNFWIPHPLYSLYESFLENACNGALSHEALKTKQNKLLKIDFRFAWKTVPRWLNMYI